MSDLSPEALRAFVRVAELARQGVDAPPAPEYDTGFEGEAYADFREERGNVDLRRLTRFISTQEDIIMQFMEDEFRASSARSRRQAINFMLEFCALLAEGFEGGGGEPLQLLHQVQGHGVLGAAGTVFHLDRQAQAFANAAQALDPFSAAFAQHLAVAAALTTPSLTVGGCCVTNVRAMACAACKRLGFTSSARMLPELSITSTTASVRVGNNSTARGRVMANNTTVSPTAHHSARPCLRQNCPRDEDDGAVPGGWAHRRERRSSTPYRAASTGSNNSDHTMKGHIRRMEWSSTMQCGG